jgi:hypothetical protein
MPMIRPACDPDDDAGAPDAPELAPAEAFVLEPSSGFDYACRAFSGEMIP